MPLYTFRNDKTGEVKEVSMKMSEREDHLKQNPHITQLITSAPAIGDAHRLGIVKTPDSFNSLLKHIKKGNSKGVTQSNINTR
jgi:hypothetical protein|tara:strand:+ start:1401 stop:1649 length:249 start_codon:yes stop_codon:yes gene_type:complete